MPQELGRSERIQRTKTEVPGGAAGHFAPRSRFVPRPGFGAVLLLILAQLVFRLAAPDEEWANFVSVVLQAAILGTAMIAFSVMAVPLLYLWQLFVAAYEADQELRDELDGLKSRAQYADGRPPRRLRGLVD